MAMASGRKMKLRSTTAIHKKIFCHGGATSQAPVTTAAALHISKHPTSTSARHFPRSPGAHISSTTSQIVVTKPYHLKKNQNGHSRIATSSNLTKMTSYTASTSLAATSVRTLFSSPRGSICGSRNARSTCLAGRNNHSAIKSMQLPPHTMAMSSQLEKLKPVLRFETGCASHPHPKRIDTGGEDAYFIHKDSPFLYSLGVADGVAQWRFTVGADPAMFPRQLVEGAENYIRERSNPKTHNHNGGSASMPIQHIVNSNNNSQSSSSTTTTQTNSSSTTRTKSTSCSSGHKCTNGSSVDDDGRAESIMNNEDYCDIDPCDVMQAACRHAEMSHVLGSSTLCVVSLNGYGDPDNDTPTGTLSACNLGDSQFVLIRNNKIIFKSYRQHHYFGVPYQFGYAPNIEFCSISDADAVNLKVHPGDLLILGTDGLFDNVMDYQLEHHAKYLSKKNSLTPKRLAQKLADYAKLCSQSPLKDTPHSLETSEKTGHIYRGGKQDDITVLVSQILGV